jgi:hypothetical protein
MAEEIQSFKDVQAVLDPIGVDKSVKAAAFDAFYDTSNAEDFQKRFDSINLPKEAKAKLWDMRFGQERRSAKEAGSALTVPKAGRLALEEMPAIGAGVGAIAGYGVPGAMAGGALGKAAQRAIKYKMGEAPPAQAGEFATDIGLEGAKQGAFEAAGPIAKAAFGRPAEKVGEALYKGSLSFPPLESLPARREAAQQGLRLGIPVSEKKGLPMVQDFVQQMAGKVDAEIAAAKKAGRMVDTQQILQPVEDQITEYAKSLAPDNPVQAAEGIRDQIRRRLGGQNINIAQAGGGTVSGVSQPPRFMDVGEAQEAKRATSRTLRKAYGEEKGPAIEALKAGERGAKEAIETAAPGVKDPNWQEHVALTLQDSIERAVKTKPGFLKDWTPYILGSSIASFAMGHPGIGEAGALAAVVREAIRNPAMMSRLAIALDRTGVVLPKIAKVGGQVARYGTPALTLPDLPPSQLPGAQQ